MINILHFFKCIWIVEKYICQHYKKKYKMYSYHVPFCVNWEQHHGSCLHDTFEMST